MVVIISKKTTAPDSIESFGDGSDTIGVSSSHTDTSSYDEKQGTHHVEHYGELINDDKHYKFMGLSGTKLHNLISVMAGTGFLLFGYDQGVMGSLLTLPAFYEQFPSMDTHTQELKSKNSTWQGFVVAVYEIGCLVGALATMYVGDKLGRRKTIVLGCTIMIIGAVIQTASFSAGQLLVARIITGIGNGFNTSTVPVWQSECAKPERRGPLVMIAGALISCGIMISYWIDFGFFFVKHNSASWRFPLAFQIVFPLVIYPFIMYLPESPRWLIKKGRIHEAAVAFSALDDEPANHPVVLERIKEIEDSINMERKADGTTGSGTRLILKQGKSRNFQRVMLAIFSQIMQQITGINLITYYATMVFEDFLGMDAMTSRILAACNGTEYFLAAWIAYYTVEKVGRRKLMIFGAAGQAASMAILCGTQWAATPPRHNNGAAITACVFLFVFNTFFAIGWLGMSWLLPAELTPINCRAPANGISTAANWCFNFVIVMTTPVGNDQIGNYLYLVYAVLNALMVPTVYFFYPETSGRSLEEMDEIFEECNPWRPWEAVWYAKRKPTLANSLSSDIEEDPSTTASRHSMSRASRIR
nr:Stl1.3 [Starmerella bombicola]